MITELKPNRYRLNSRIAIQILLLIGLLFSVYVVISLRDIHPSNSRLIKDYSILIALCIFNIGFFLELCFLPFWATIDDELKTLVIKYMIIPSKLVKITDIEGYSTVNIKSRSGGYFGMILYLPSNKRVLLSDMTFDNYKPVQTFLDSLNVKQLGEEDYNFISYIKHQ
jgi:hypothetical protein